VGDYNGPHRPSRTWLACYFIIGYSSVDRWRSVRGGGSSRMFAPIVKRAGLLVLFIEEVAESQISVWASIGAPSSTLGPVIYRALPGFRSFPW